MKKTIYMIKQLKVRRKKLKQNFHMKSENTINNL